MLPRAAGKGVSFKTPEERHSRRGFPKRDRAIG
jgi:hypothetical protein